MGDQPPTPGQEVTCGARGEAEIPMTGPFPKTLFVPWATPPVHSPVEGIAVFWEDGVTHVRLDACPGLKPTNTHLPGETGSVFTEPWPFPPPDYVIKTICKTPSGPFEICYPIIDGLPAHLAFVGVIAGKYQLVLVDVTAMDNTGVTFSVISVEEENATEGSSGQCLSFIPKIKMCEAYALED